MPITDSAPLFVAIRHGLFAKRNLEVEPVAVSGGARAVEATAKEYIWANPHVWFYVDIPGENGRPVEWILESAAPASLSRNG